MKPPIDFACPDCPARPGEACLAPADNKNTFLSIRFHHAGRVDAAFRARGQEARDIPIAGDDVAKFDHLVDTLDLEALRDMYRSLRARYARASSVYEAAIEWRLNVTLAPASPYTQRLIDAIDAVLNTAIKDPR